MQIKFFLLEQRLLGFDKVSDYLKEECQKTRTRKLIIIKDDIIIKRARNCVEDEYYTIKDLNCEGNFLLFYQIFFLIIRKIK